MLLTVFICEAVSRTSNGENAPQLTGSKGGKELELSQKILPGCPFPTNIRRESVLYIAIYFA